MKKIKDNRICEKFPPCYSAEILRASSGNAEPTIDRARGVWPDVERTKNTELGKKFDDEARIGNDNEPINGINCAFRGNR